MRTILISLALVLSVFALTANSQTSDHPALTLFNQGKFKEVVKLLKPELKKSPNKNDSTLWNCFGLANYALMDYKSAKGAFEKAVELSPTNSAVLTNLGYSQLMTRDISGALSSSRKAIALDATNVHSYYLKGLASYWNKDLEDAKQEVDRILTMDRCFKDAYRLAYLIELSHLSKAVRSEDDGEQGIRENVAYLKNAVDVFRSFSPRCGREDPELTRGAESLNTFVEFFSKARSPIPGQVKDPDVTPLKILSKQRPRYTDAARNNGVSGEIKLAVLFGASGRIEYAFVLDSLGYGLDEEASRAAFSIKFEPEKLKGVAVPTVRIVSFHFKIY